LVVCRSGPVQTPRSPDSGETAYTEVSWAADTPRSSRARMAAAGDPPELDPQELARLRARPYQEELLQKAIAGNTIVYLGTGSGKTFIAVMLIREMKGLLVGGTKVRVGVSIVQAIFLVSSVALVEQQARQVEEQTGLTVGSYCGADGVDDWDGERWKAEIAQHQVLVLVHQVFLDLMTHSFFLLSSAAVLVMDECHHAQGGKKGKNHPYSQIMRDRYHMLKEAGSPVPKVLGLSGCLVVTGTDEHKFREDKLALEQVRSMNCI